MNRNRGQRNGGGIGFYRDALQGLIQANEGNVWEYSFLVDDVDHTLVIDFPKGENTGMVTLKRESVILASKRFPGFGFNLNFDYVQDRGLAKKVYDAFIDQHPHFKVEFDPYTDDDGNTFTAGIYAQDGGLYVYAEGPDGQRVDHQILKRFTTFGFGFWDLLAGMRDMIQEMRNMRNQFNV